MTEMGNIEEIVRNATRAASDKKISIEAKSQSLILIDDEAWDEGAIPARPWVAEGFLLRGAVTVIVGAPAAGKSSLMVGWAASLALGMEYGKLKPVQPLSVMTYNVEDDRDEQRRRFTAFLRWSGHSPCDLSSKLARLGTDGVGTLLTLSSETGICGTPAMQQLERELEARKPDVLMLDPFVELHEAEENDNTSVRTVMAYFRSLAIKYNMAVVLLHHTRKGAAGSPGDPDVARGASAVIGAARIVLTVSVMTEQEAQNFGLPADHHRYFSRVDGAKINAAPIGKEEWFERQPYELSNGDRVAMMRPWTPPQDSVSVEQKLAITADLEKGSSTGPWNPRITSEDRSVKMVFDRHGVTGKLAQRKLLDELKHQGWEIAEYRKSNRVPAKGLRSPDGAPVHVDWLEGSSND
ncbi:AAA family ATPase [Acetobacter cerevisiae]|uniref:AAA family ATPase n=1 Tax=Acetobacter cerevisiae TaxID=178900 RepID=UPI0020A0E831|nr:AAA family ATPase [Acetobacter cerevisiae]MCP1269469.1 helicase RepA family protein [Acetobacter cerevisiae]MCP1277423.1 helicase RepA family protein [Acetobacter cerevisiae]